MKSSPGTFCTPCRLLLGEIATTTTNVRFTFSMCAVVI